MNLSLPRVSAARGTLAQIGKWSARLPARLRNKLAGFERTIGTFRQRRWS